MPANDLRLTPGDLRRVCSVDHFEFKSTEELPDLKDIIGQPRGVRAIEFGTNIQSRGYNIYVLGPSGTGRTTAIHRYLEERAAEGTVPMDWVYVHNFAASHKPRAIELEPGMGARLRADIAVLVERLQREIPDALDTEEFHEERETITHAFESTRDSIMGAMREKVAEKDFAMINTQSGVAIVPVADGQPMSQEAFGQLSEDERKALDEVRHELDHGMEDALRDVSHVQRETNEALRELEATVVGVVLDQHMLPIRDICSGHEEALFWLNEVRSDILSSLDNFKSSDKDGGRQDSARPPGLDAQPIDSGEHFLRYQVNLIVDHSDSNGPPVVLLDLPTYQNLIGRIEAEVRFGAMTTNFSMIKGGALHQANGGYLVVRANDVLSQPFAWEGLKRALGSGEIRIEEPESRSGAAVMRPQTPEPEPIPLSVKVVLMGNSELYYLLHDVDEDFRELFKVKADFTGTMERNHDNEHFYALFVAGRCNEDVLPHFSPDGVGKVVEFGSWLAGEQNKLSTRFGEIADLVHEAAYWARDEGKDVVSAEDVARAVEERVYRSNLIEERMQERIQEGKVFIDLDGEVVGQINGLAVLSLGDYVFGQPSRVTARTYIGTEGVINIDREVEMTGPIHNKGLMILHGYMGGQYADEQPLSLTASITFEQNYGGIEGDSASSTELYVLLSALSGYPIGQNIAVTGSVNQFGKIQPIGGATHKIEGFYKVCKARGLTGEQGVIIPASNSGDLMLSEEVVKAVEDGKFHVYAVSSIDEGIEILTGMPAGKRGEDGSYAEDTVHHAVQVRLQELAEGLEEFSEYRQS